MAVCEKLLVFFYRIAPSAKIHLRFRIMFPANGKDQIELLTFYQKRNYIARFIIKSDTCIQTAL